MQYVTSKEAQKYFQVMDQALRPLKMRKGEKRRFDWFMSTHERKGKKAETENKIKDMIITRDAPGMYYLHIPYVLEEIESDAPFKIVADDPGKNDLLMAMNEDGDYFRYTQAQRNHETKKKKYNEIRSEVTEERVNGKRISDHEKVLTDYDSKTCIFSNFKE